MAKYWPSVSLQSALFSVPLPYSRQQVLNCYDGEGKIRAYLLSEMTGNFCSITARKNNQEHEAQECPLNIYFSNELIFALKQLRMFKIRNDRILCSFTALKKRIIFCLGWSDVASDGSDHHQHVLHDPRRHDLPLHLRHRLHLIHAQHRLRLRHLQRRKVA